jgi:hypothetical protein
VFFCMCSPKIVGGERFVLGDVESKSRDLGNDRGYRVAHRHARLKGDRWGMQK